MIQFLVFDTLVLPVQISKAIMFPSSVKIDPGSRGNKRCYI